MPRTSNKKVEEEKEVKKPTTRKKTTTSSSTKKSSSTEKKTSTRSKKTTDSKPKSVTRVKELRIKAAGPRENYIYFDTEFTKLNRNTELISIGLVNADGKTFYAEFTDFSLPKDNHWLIQNVITKLQLTDTDNVAKGDHWTIRGNRAEISTMLWAWLNSVRPSETTVMQFVSDVAHYDFVLLIELLLLYEDKSALDLPGWISPCVYDINHDIADLVANFKEDPNELDYNPIQHAFDMPRHVIAASMGNQLGMELPQGNQHNALFDAEEIRIIHQYLYNLEK